MIIQHLLQPIIRTKTVSFLTLAKNIDFYSNVSTFIQMSSSGNGERGEKTSLYIQNWKENNSQVQTTKKNHVKDGVQHGTSAM